LFLATPPDNSRRGNTETGSDLVSRQQPIKAFFLFSR
jgi:hypothetical protein